jgi:hypothetical protein
MRTRRRTRRTGAMLGAALALVGSIAAMGTWTVSASSDAAINGALSATPVSSGADPAQLLAGSDGSLWFVTAHSNLGRIDNNGAATLTGVTLPHGNIPATLAAAGAEGVWAYGNSLDFTHRTFSCIVALVRPGGGIFEPTLPQATANHYCADAAADRQGNLWVAFSVEQFNYCPCRPGFVAEITTSGQVTVWDLVRPGALPHVVVLGSDGAIWVLEGSITANIARYTASGPPSPGISTYGRRDGLWARPDGTFWWSQLRYCGGLIPSVCPRLGIITQSGGLPLNIILPVTYPEILSSPGPLHLMLTTAPDGTLWIAGHEKDGISRFFRVDTDGTVDRSSAFPTGTSGAQLQAEGPIAITPAGTAWAVASDGATTYVVRFAPLN